MLVELGDSDVTDLTLGLAPKDIPDGSIDMILCDLPIDNLIMVDI